MYNIKKQKKRQKNKQTIAYDRYHNIPKYAEIKLQKNDITNFVITTRKQAALKSNKKENQR